MREWSSPNYYSSILVGTLKKKKKNYVSKVTKCMKIKKWKKKKEKRKKRTYVSYYYTLDFVDYIKISLCQESCDSIDWYFLVFSKHPMFKYPLPPLLL